MYMALCTLNLAVKLCQVSTVQHEYNQNYPYYGTCTANTGVCVHQISLCIHVPVCAVVVDMSVLKLHALLDERVCVCI